MNNLLRTLTESTTRPPTDLRLLLNTVKEGRKQCADNKLSDAFYDALEGLLLDLKMITLDNRDAEAFLKPVSKAEVPDYYDVIASPMDFQTMVKKVKQKQYKSKREFNDDLELIWSNCYTYNASENHPLRQCVKRLKAKADRLLKHVTDRRERTDPFIPPELGFGFLPKMNGFVSRTHTRSPSYSSTTKGGTPGLAAVKPSPSLSRQSTFNSNIPFPESDAIVRTPEGMGMFYELDREVVAALRKPNQQILRRLKDLVPSALLLDGSGEEQEEEDTATPKEDEEMADGIIVGDKRKQPSPQDPNSRPRKRARFVTPPSTENDQAKDDLPDLWWAAAQSDTLLANGVPPIPFGPSSSSSKARPSPSSSSSYPTPSSSLSSLAFASSSSSSHHLSHYTLTPTSIPEPKPKPKRRKSSSSDDGVGDEKPPTHVDNPKALLNLMNTNIKTMRRVRHTHGKFAALNATTLANEEAVEEGAGAGAGGPGAPGGPIPGPSSSGGAFDGLGIGAASSGTVGGEALNAAADDEILNEKVDERPWVMMQQQRLKGKGKERQRAELVRGGGADIGEKNAWGCMQWTNQKILEHVGFQGASQIALDVMSGVLSEYISNVGRTIKYMCDKHSEGMTPEEIVLHTLFESGSSKVQDLERYIRDDVERYSSRLNELEKKIVGAYRETTAGETLEDEGLFAEEDEEEAGALAIGDFADMLGEDYLGLRELGIAQEFGMSSLSIPKKLLKSKKQQLKLGINGGGGEAKSNEPPPPYPPPSKFVKLKSDKVDDQIGLLRGYYMGRFTGLAEAAMAKPVVQTGPGGVPPLTGPMLGVPTLSGPKLTMPTLPGPTLSQPQLPPPLPGPTLPPASAPTPAPPASTPGLPSTKNIVVPGATPPPTQLGQQPLDFATLPIVLELPDDQPTGVHIKMGPLGQIVKGGGAGGAGKKKAKAAAGAGGAPSAAVGAGGSGSGPSVAPVNTTGAVPAAAGADSGTPKKKKGAGNMGVGSGNGRKKKPGADGGAQQQSQQGQGSPSYPPAVVASA